MERLGFQSLLMLALVARGETIGLMEIADINDRPFTPQDVEFCQAVCDVVATSHAQRDAVRAGARAGAARPADRAAQPPLLRRGARAALARADAAARRWGCW